MALLIAAIVGDFRGILDLLLLFLAFSTCARSSISSSCGGIRLFASSMMALLLLFLLGLLRGLLGFVALFGLIGLILNLQSCDVLVSLIVPGIKTHLQGSFFLRALLIQEGYSFEFWPWPQPYWLH